MGRKGRPSFRIPPPPSRQKARNAPVPSHTPRRLRGRRPCRPSQLQGPLTVQKEGMSRGGEPFPRSPPASLPPIPPTKSPQKPTPYPFIPRSHPPETALPSLSHPARSSLPAQKASPLSPHLPKSPSRNRAADPFAPGPQLPVRTKNRLHPLPALPPHFLSRNETQECKFF